MLRVSCAAPLVGSLGVFLFLANASAQQPIPGVRAERQEPAYRLVMAYMGSLFLITCDKMFPGIPQIKNAQEALVNASKDLEDSFLDDDLDAIRMQAVKVFDKYELLLKTKPDAFSECSGIPQAIAGQIIGGMFKK